MTWKKRLVADGMDQVKGDCGLNQGVGNNLKKK